MIDKLSDRTLGVQDWEDTLLENNTMTVPVSQDAGSCVTMLNIVKQDQLSKLSLTTAAARP